MKAVRIHGHGGPEVLRYEDVPDPSPGSGEVLIDLKAVGVNFADIGERLGRIPMEIPAIVGREAAGVVSQVGEGVSEVEAGDLVAYTGVSASYAEKVVAPSWLLVKLPQGMKAETGAAAMLQGMTAHCLAYDAYPLTRGDKAVVHAGAGGTGLLLIQMAKRLGAYVFATVSTQAKAAVAQDAGADEVIVYTEEDFDEAVNKATDGEGVQVVYDSVGQSTFEKGFNCLALQGYMVLYGQASGPVPAFDSRILSTGSHSLVRPFLGHYTRNREELLHRAEAVLSGIQSGKLTLRIHTTLPLSDAREAHRQLEGRLTTGKLLLIP